MLEQSAFKFGIDLTLAQLDQITRKNLKKFLEGLDEENSVLKLNAFVLTHLLAMPVFYIRDTH